MSKQTNKKIDYKKLYELWVKYEKKIIDHINKEGKHD